MKVLAACLLLAIACGFSTAEEAGGIHEVIVTHVKPEHWYQFREEIKKHPAFEAKHNIDVLGRYKPIAGGIGDLITFVKFDNMEQKVKETKALFEDPEFIAHHNHTAHFVDDVFVATCIPVPGFPHHKPDPKSFVFVQKVHVKGFPKDSVDGFKEFFDAANDKHIKSKGLNLIGVFRPVYGKNVQQYIVSYELTGANPLEAPGEVVKAIMGDESLKALKEKVWGNVVKRESYLLAPVAVKAATLFY